MTYKQLQFKYKSVFTLLLALVLFGCQNYTNDKKLIYNNVKEACIHKAALENYKDYEHEYLK